jgi:RNA polymerase sigma-70 factor (ECF subfamily)
MRAEVEQAIAQLQGNRPDGVERALALLQNTVYSFSMKVCGHRQDAEDTMQETLLKAMGYLRRFDNPRALAVWLYKVAKNHCLMSRRRSKYAPKQDLSLEELMPDRTQLEKLHAAAQENPEQALLRSENRQVVQKAVLQIPPSYRLVLVLHDMEGLSTAEVAQVLGIREGTVRVRLHRARVFLRNQLARTPARGKRLPEKSRRPRGCKELFAELSDYLDGALDDALCDELEKHLDGCAPCETFLDSLEQTVEQCRLHTSTRLNPRAAARTRKALLEEYQQVLASRRKGATT